MKYVSGVLLTDVEVLWGNIQNFLADWIVRNRFASSKPSNSLKQGSGFSGKLDLGVPTVEPAKVAVRAGCKLGRQHAASSGFNIRNNMLMICWVPRYPQKFRKSH